MPRKHNVDEINLKIDTIDFWGPWEQNKGGMRIYWSSAIGFGTLDIVKRKGYDGEDPDDPEENLLLTANTELMDSQDDKAFTTKIMSLLVEKLQIDG